MNQFTLQDLDKTAGACVGVDDKTEPITENNADKSFEDLGYDSLAIFELTTKLEHDLPIQVSDDEIEGLVTPRAVVEFINRKLAAPIAPNK